MRYSAGIPEGRSQRTTLVLFTLAGAILLALYATLEPGQSRLFWTCPLFSWTGWYCPGCGSQRAVHALLHGQVRDAVGLNAYFALVLLPFGSWAASRWARDAWTGRQRPWPYAAQFALVAALAAGVVFGVARNVPGPIGVWLAP